MSSAGIDKLPIYASLGVQEVWFWCDGKFDLFSLVGDGYESIATSARIAGLDLNQVEEFVNMTDQHRAVKTYLALLRQAAL